MDVSRKECERPVAEVQYARALVGENETRRRKGIDTARRDPKDERADKDLHRARPELISATELAGRVPRRRRMCGLELLNPSLSFQDRTAGDVIAAAARHDE